VSNILDPLGITTVFETFMSLTLVALVAILNLAKIKINWELDKITTEFVKQGNTT
jgi:hypothetical protein